MSRTPTLVQLNDRLLAQLDQRAAARGISRSQLIREALEAYLAQDTAAAISRRIVEGYERVPQATLDEWGQPLQDAAAMARFTFQRLDEEERRAGTSW